MREIAYNVVEVAFTTLSVEEEASISDMQQAGVFGGAKNFLTSLERWTDDPVLRSIHHLFVASNL